MIPPELRSFLDSKILSERSTKLSPEAIADAVQTAVDIADSPEGNVYDLITTGTLPSNVLTSDVAVIPPGLLKAYQETKSTNTPWQFRKQTPTAATQLVRGRFGQPRKIPSSIIE